MIREPTAEYSNPKTSLVSEAMGQKYYPSLNGLRGVSIIMVIVAHLHLSWAWWYVYIFNGTLGVNIFFVLSGFLITTICLKEIRSTGTLSLKNFYIRRVLRIFPVAYLFVAVAFALNKIYHQHIPYYQFLADLFYVMNFSFFRRNHASTELGHFWSLSVEEQFYIISPFLLKKSFKTFYWSLIFIIFLLPLICTLQDIYKPLNQGVLYFFARYFIKFQSIAIGCLLSVLAFQKRLDFEWLHSYKLIGNIAAVVVIIYLKYDSFYSIKSVYLNLIMSLLIGYIVITNIVTSDDLVYKLLNLRWLSFIGVLSYSLYIWQNLFLLSDAGMPKVISTLPWNVVLVITISLLSYFFYEKYFLRLKLKFSVTKHE